MRFGIENPYAHGRLKMVAAMDLTVFAHPGRCQSTTG
jgi:hypothetical protein